MCRIARCSNNQQGCAPKRPTWRLKCLGRKSTHSERRMRECRFCGGNMPGASGSNRGSRRVAFVCGFEVRAFAVAVGAVGQILAAHAGSAPTASAPSFADFRLGASDNLIDENFILRQPFLVGGASHDAFHEAPDVAAFGAFARPLREDAGKGEWTIGSNYVAHVGARQWEVQAKYVSPSGIGLGGGLVD